MISTLGSGVPLAIFTSNKVKRDQRRLRSDQKGLRIVFLDQKCLSFGGLGIDPPIYGQNSQTVFDRLPTLG